MLTNFSISVFASSLVILNGNNISGTAPFGTFSLIESVFLHQWHLACVLDVVSITTSEPQLEHFKVILGDEISGEKFLISQSGYDYYIKGYDYTDSYVLIKDSGLAITDEDIEYAKEKIKNKINIYTLNGENFKIYNLRNALYNSTIDILWLKNFDYIEEKNNDLNIKNIKLERITEDQDYQFYNEDKKEKLILKNVIINGIETNEGYLKNLDEYVKQGNSFDLLIASLPNLYKITLVNAKGILTSNDQRIIDIGDFKIAFEHEYLEGYIVYYIYFFE